MHHPSHNRTIHVGAPDPEAKNSPIVGPMDDEFELTGIAEEHRGCYFNNTSYDYGTFLESGGGELLYCENGVWIKEA